MSRSTFLTTKETELRYHHGLISPVNRPNETPASKTTNISINRHNPKTKRNLRDKRRATGIRPNDVPLASTSTEGSANEEDEEEAAAGALEDSPSKYHNDQTNAYELNLTLTPSGPSKPVFTVNRLQPTFETLSISRAGTNAAATSKTHRPEESRRHRVDKPNSDDDLALLAERIHTLETIVHEKDNQIHDLQQKLTNATQSLTDAEEQIHKLHQDKLTLIKAFTTIQENKSPPLRASLMSRK